MVESHNALLAKKIAGKTTVYRFLDALAKEENRKAVQFVQLEGGRVGVFEEPAPRYVKRSKAIAAAQKKLKDGQISVSEFLNMVTNNQNRNLAIDLANFDGEGDNAGHEEEDDAEESNDSTICVICTQNQRRILLKPCDHFIMCVACYVPLMECPRCHIVTTSCDVI